MNCGKCGTENPAAAKFCLNCGSPLKFACPQCATELPTGAKFCFNCGHRLGAPVAPPSPAPPPVIAVTTPAPAPAAEPAPAQRISQYIPTELLAKLEAARAAGGMIGERRVVTMLFCDVQGSTAAAEKMDPEEWAEIMNGAFEHLISPVYRYEGTLARLMGDAILAFFGAPIAHEDDPQRAVLAGLDIHQGIQPYREKVKQRWGLDFNVRVGINTGLVVVGEVGSDLRVEYTALGDAVNLAARMEQTAKPGTVQVSENTHRLVAPLFDFEDLGEVPVKGKAEPVRIYRALRPKAVPGSLRGIQGLDSPLVGRDREMAALLTHVLSLREGVGRILSVTGEAGLGKSRLVAEARRALTEQGVVSSDGAGVAWHEARCRSYETSTPFAPLIGLFNSLAGLQPEEPDEARYKRLREWLAGLGEGAAQSAPYIATMLGVQFSGPDADRVKYLDPPQVREGIFASVAGILRQMAATRPRVLLFEDLHWADPTSMLLVERLMALPEQVALLLVGVFRPGRQEPSWRFHEAGNSGYPHLYTSIALEPLDAAHSRQLVANLLHIEDLPERVRALILEKAEGNPFFVEEVIRSLLDAGLVIREEGHWRATREIENISVPGTLSGVITARLDRIGEESRRVAQTAAVVGREFSLDALEHLHGRQGLLDSLVDLQRRELVRERSRIPRRVFSFKHALTQETVYASILLSRRRDLHRRLGEWLEGTSPDDQAEIARHFVEAREPARALPHLAAAGEKAARAYSSAEAIRFFSQAIEVLDDPGCDAGLARRAFEGLGGAYTFLGKPMEALEVYRKMQEHALAKNDVAMQVSALNKSGFVHALFLGDLEQAERILVQSESLARPSGERPGLAELNTYYCMLKTTYGHFDEAFDRLTQAEQIGREMNLLEPQLFSMTHLANTMNYMTRFDEAKEMAQRALALARESGHKAFEADLLGATMPMYLMRDGDIEAARRSALQGMQVAQEIGSMMRTADAAMTLGMLERMTGNYQGALDYFQMCRDTGQMSGMAYLQAAGLCGLGTTYLEISDDLKDKAMALHDQAIEVMSQPMGTAVGTMLWADAGFCYLGVGELERARTYFQRGLTVYDTMRLVLRPQLLIGSAIVAIADGDSAKASDLLQEARRFAEERAMRHFFPALELSEGLLASARGDMSAALHSMERAEAMAHGLSMRPILWHIQMEEARVLDFLQREAEAESKRAQAWGVCQQIAASLQDRDLRAKFIAFSGRQLGREPHPAS